MRVFYYYTVKKALIVIGIIIGSIVLLSGSAIGLLHLKGVQNFFIQKVTKQLSEKWQVDVHIDHFHYRPLTQLDIEHIYLSDQQLDTLAYIDQLHLRFDPLSLSEQRIDISQLVLSDTYLNLQKRSDSTLNCQFLIDSFKKDSANFPFVVNIDQLRLERTRMRYNELLVDQLDLDFSLPVYSQDSLQIRVDSMHLRAQIDQLDATLELQLHGDLDSLYADTMQVVFRGEQLFLGNLAVFHPTQLDSMYIQANCSQLYCTDKLLQDLLSQLQMHKVKLPPIISNIERLHYTGDIKGQLDDFHLHGAFRSPLGTLQVNGAMQMDPTLRFMDFQGHLSTKNFQLGQLVDHNDLGAISLHAYMEGRFDSTQLTHAKAKGEVSQLEYKGYTYQNINLDGAWSINELSGHMSIQDQNVQMSINGLTEWDKQDIRIDLEIALDHIHPSALHLTEQYPDLSLGATTHVTLYTSGEKEHLLDNLNGYVIIDSLQIQNAEKYALIEQFKVLIDNKLEGNSPHHQLRIQSDFLTANLSGEFRYRTLPTTFQQLAHEYLPALFDKPISKTPYSNSLDFYAYFRELDVLSDVLNLKVSLPAYPTIKGYIHQDQVGLQAYIPHINTSGIKMQDMTISLDNDDESMDLSIYVLNHLPQDNPTAAKLGDIKTTFNVSAANNNIDLDIQLGNTDSVRNEGKISISSLVSKYMDKPKIDVQILPTHIILNDSAWNISRTDITYTHANQTLDIHDLWLNTDYQSIKADGTASPSVNDSIEVELDNINLNYILSYTEANKAISIMGPVTGNATVYSVFSECMLEANAKIKNGGLNGVYFGDIDAQARLDRESKSILIHGEIVDSSQVTVAVVDGKVVPAKKWWGLDITCDSIDASFINFWTEGIVSDIRGRAYGRVKVEGKQREVYVTGRALAKNASITVPQIGVTYNFSDSVFLDSTAIIFPNIRAYDQYGNQGSINGGVYHQHFTNIHFDLRAQANKLLVMDLPADQQALFYGKVFGTGDVHIHGNEKDCFIDVNARTEANTKFILNINSASQATSSNFIHFTQPDTSSYSLLRLLQPTTKATPKQTPQSRLKLTLQGEVTPQAEITIKMGGDDGIKGRGEGNLKLIYESPSENIQMQGAYTLQSGQFTFSLGNIVRRNFTIREGSRITWDSDPLAPMVNITGFYHTNASLHDLFGSERAQIATNRTSVPVNCVLQMRDQLFNPVLNFSIELPQSDESVQSQVKSLINTEEMLMRQIIYLLVFNRFYTPEYLQNTQNVGLNETYSLLSSTITGQINSWLSKLTDVFTMGFNFRTDGEGETASQEYAANFQIHPINQLIINGNIGYRYNDLSNRPFFGDLDVEYLLTENGKLRVKAYTHTVDKYSLRQANTVQGVGFVFKHDFNIKKASPQKSTTDKKRKRAKKD